MVSWADDGAYAVQMGHDWKLVKYANRCMKEGLAFLSMAVDTFGSWHMEALGLITKLARVLAHRVGGKDGKQVHHLCQRLGITLVWNNMAMLLARRSFATCGVGCDLYF